jgi:hypothetical protein
MKYETVKMFVAYDGTKFESESDCAHYESLLLEGIPRIVKNQEDLYGGSPFCLYIFFKIKNESQATRFAKWVKCIDGGDKIDIDKNKLIGNIVVVDCRNEIYDGIDGIETIYSVETISENITRYAKTLYEIASGLEGRL